MDKKTLDKSLALEQWKLCVEMANAISNRRDVMNNLMVTLNIAMVVAYTYSHVARSATISIVGCISCIVWVLLVRYYRTLNEVKFEIINEMEKELPMQPFTEEWEKVNSKKGFIQSTKLENLFPIVFLIIHIISVVLIVWR